MDEEKDKQEETDEREQSEGQAPVATPASSQTDPTPSDGGGESSGPGK